MGIELRTLGKTTCTFNHWAFSPADTGIHNEEPGQAAGI